MSLVDPKRKFATRELRANHIQDYEACCKEIKYLMLNAISYAVDLYSTIM